jgi:hypothetical protein
MKNKYLLLLPLLLISFAFVSADDTTPPYFTTSPTSDEVEWGLGWNGADFDATDETQFDSFAVNDTNFEINQDGLLKVNYDIAGDLDIGFYSVLITINDTSNNINTTTFVFEVTKNTGSCSIVEIWDYYEEPHNVLSNPTEYTTQFYVRISCGNGMLDVNGTPYVFEWITGVESGVYNLSIIRSSENFEDYYTELLFEILPKSVTTPTGIGGSSSSDLLTGQVTAETQQGISLFAMISNWFKLIWEWIVNLFK